MKRWIGVMCTMLVACSIAWAQAGEGGAAGGRRGGQRQQPCYLQAGVSKSAMQQARQLQQEARQQIQSVCANNSISDQQKRDQIRQIRESTRTQVDALVSPAQRQQIEECRAARGQGGGSRGGSGGGGNPCHLGRGNRNRPVPQNQVPQDQQSDRPQGADDHPGK